MSAVGYFLAGYGKRNILSTEAAVKYMVFSGLAGALFLYGAALLFSATHAFNIYEIHKALVANPLSAHAMPVVFMLILLALTFYIGAFPMYMWEPDTLEGAPTPVSAFMSFGPRAAGFAVAVRFLIVIFGQPGARDGHWEPLGILDWPRIVAVISGITMLAGSLLALRQRGAKRMVSCLVVAESGYLLMGLLVLDQVGVAALLYNLVIELFALVGIFSVLAFFQDEFRSDKLDDLRGALRRSSPEVICLVLFLICLVGLPPTPGFIGKFALIGAALRHKWPILAIIALASMTLSTGAVARLSYHLIGDFHQQDEVGPSASYIVNQRQRQIFLVGLLLPLLIVGVFSEFVFGWAGKSLGFILW
jgi:NADH-quinone oxidoreductase subunit N